MGAGHRAVGLILEIAQGGLSQPLSSRTAGSFPGRGRPELGGGRGLPQWDDWGGQMPSRDFWAGHGWGSYGMGANLRGGVVQKEPFPPNDLKLDKTNKQKKTSLRKRI